MSNNPFDSPDSNKIPIDKIANRPSVMVACIGNKFLPGCKEGIFNATHVYSVKTGAKSGIIVEQNLTVLPPLGLGVMRNFMVMTACNEGFDYLLIIDNDVLVDDEDLIIKLVATGKQYVVPYFDQESIRKDGEVYKIHEPMYRKGQGILKLKWTTPYLNLISTMCFRLTGERPFTESMIFNEDCFNSLWFTRHGIQIWQDTNTSVNLLRGPQSLSEHMQGLKLCGPDGEYLPDEKQPGYIDYSKLAEEVKRRLNV